jgi:hypothetical protein
MGKGGTLMWFLTRIKRKREADTASAVEASKQDALGIFGNGGTRSLFVVYTLLGKGGYSDKVIDRAMFEMARDGNIVINDPEHR